MKGNRTRQHDAVMVYMAAMAAVMTMMVLFAYNAGDITNEKARFQNTTDSAIHSIAMPQSREFNFQACINRALTFSQMACSDKCINFLNLEKTA